jgi:uncharacterized membrane protein/ribosomal protein L12E/L44/L45/RPP1/RPP2
MFDFEIPFINYKIAFAQGGFLWLVFLLPLLWLVSFRSLAGLGRNRRIMALTLRSLVLVSFIVALAEIQVMRISDKIAVYYLLDQSESIPKHQRQLMLEYVQREVVKHRNSDRGDLAGVIIFGRDALVEIQAFDEDLPSIGQIEGYRELETDATNLAAALRQAIASFPEDAAKRVVVVTDGNENIGSARAVAPTLAENGIGIDVIPIKLGKRGEIVMDKMTLPNAVRKGQPVSSRIVVSNLGDKDVPGKLVVVRSVGQQEQLLDDRQVILHPGKNMFLVEQDLNESGVFTYKARFIPDDADSDIMSENNETTAFTHVRGKGRILIIEDWEHPGRFDYLAGRLRNNELEVDVMPSNNLFNSLAELQAYDCIILADVPRSSGDTATTVTNFSDERIDMLIRNTEQMGCGLIMMGGPNSFGAGGWTNTELEKAMPVDFQIKNSKVVPVGALVLMMHASEMDRGNYWQKVVGMEAIKALGPMDYCGCIHWENNTGNDAWLWNAPQGLLRVGPNRLKMVARLNRMTPGDMPAFEPAMKMTLNALRGVKAAVKHVIIISDGDPVPASPFTIAKFVNAKIQVSTVAIGTHGPPSAGPLQKLATDTGGKFYVVTNPKALPRIYQREARRVARPLVYEPENGIQPRVIDYHEIHGLSPQTLPTISGFVLTTVKDNPLVEVSILSPKPADEDNATILASWTFGLGRTAVFTSDAGNRWATEWTAWSEYDRFFTQMVRWAMRPVDENGTFLTSTNVRDGKVQIAITALDDDSNLINLLDMTATAIAPDLTAFSVPIRQVAPGRYVGEFTTDKPGSYYLAVNPGMQDVMVNGVKRRRPRPQIVTGVNVPYSAEYRDRETNLALLHSLAQTRPQGGEPGMVASGDFTPESINDFLQLDTFRDTLAKAISSRDIWPLCLLIGACVFFGDIFVRRVAIDWSWTEPALQWIRTKLGRTVEVESDGETRLERLRRRKEQVSTQMEERRAAARFEPLEEASLDDAVQQSGAGPSSTEAPAAVSDSRTIAPTVDDQDSYTARLMKAKKNALKNRNKPG